MQKRILSLPAVATFTMSILMVSGCQPYFDEILGEINKEVKDLPKEVVINEPALFPEGIEYDASGQRFLVSSQTRGTIGAVDDQGNYEPFVEDDDFVATVGIDVDEAQQRLLVCVSDPNTASVAALGSYDLRSGERQFFANLLEGVEGDAPHFANDVATDAQGNAYVTDSFSPIIYKVDPEGHASVFLQHETFQAAPGAFGLNGIVYHPHGYLIVAFSETATLYKVPLDNPESFSPIATEAGVVTSPDGLYLSNPKTLVVVNNDGGGANGQVISLNSTDRWESAELAGSFSTGPVFPTTVAQRQKNFYVIYAHLDELTGGDLSRDEFKIVRADFEEEKD